MSDDIKVKLKVEHYPGEGTGTWNDSFLKLVLRTDRDMVKKVELAIRKALAEK